MLRLLTGIAAAGTFFVSSTAVADPSAHLPGRTAEYVQDVCYDLVPDEFASVGECVSASRGNIVEFCKLLAESGALGDASAGRCIEVFSRPREEGDD
jgi:hypothetical protein